MFMTALYNRYDLIKNVTIYMMFDVMSLHKRKVDLQEHMHLHRASNHITNTHSSSLKLHAKLVYTW